MPANIFNFEVWSKWQQPSYLVDSKDFLLFPSIERLFLHLSRRLFHLFIGRFVESCVAKHPYFTILPNNGTYLDSLSLIIQYILV